MLRLNNLIIIFISCLLLCLTACQKENQQKSAQLKTVTAKLQSVPTELYYAGVVSPLEIYNVIAPDDGTVKNISFKYGEKVKKGQLLMIISSTKLQDDYRDALTNFLKAKEDYANSESNFRGSKMLRKAGIISEQDYQSEKSQYDSSYLGYLNAKYALGKIVEKIPGTAKQVEAVSLEDIPTLNKILTMAYDKLPIVAPNSGVVLFPEKGAGDEGGSGSGDGDSAGKMLQEGDTIKDGQVLFSIGDLSGFSTTVQVSELAINQIKVGQKVIVTLDALPNITFHGTVKTVAAQAQEAEGEQSGLATFPVTVVVPQLTPEQMQLIRVGMSTKITITIQNPARILIPLAAVHQQNGSTTVTIINPVSGKSQQVSVVTGQTTITDIEILQGLKAGDQVVIP